MLSLEKNATTPGRRSSASPQTGNILDKFIVVAEFVRTASVLQC